MCILFPTEQVKGFVFGNRANNGVDFPDMFQRLTTYDDWSAFLGDAQRPCGSDDARMLAQGAIEPEAVGRVYRLICAYCAECLDVLDEGLFARLRALDACDAYGAFLVCSRYCDACEHLLFFNEVDGIPVDWAQELEADIRRNMAGALRHAQTESAAAASRDGVYYLRRLLERRCKLQ